MKCGNINVKNLKKEREKEEKKSEFPLIHLFIPKSL